IFGLTPAQARESAEERVLAATIVDRITGNISTDPDADWAEVHAALQRCYRSIRTQLPVPAGPSMVGTPYAFTSNWDVSAPLQLVWDAIYNSEHWPRWWPYVAAVELLVPGNAQGEGAVRRYTWTTRLPYRLVFDLRVTTVDA